MHWKISRIIFITALAFLLSKDLLGREGAEVEVLGGRGGGARWEGREVFVYTHRKIA